MLSICKVKNVKRFKLKLTKWNIFDQRDHVHVYTSILAFLILRIDKVCIHLMYARQKVNLQLLQGYFVTGLTLFSSGIFKISASQFCRIKTWRLADVKINKRYIYDVKGSLKYILNDTKGIF